MTARTSPTSTVSGSAKPWRISLWIAQMLLAAMYIPSGLMKLAKPIADLSQQMAWTGDLPAAIVRIAGTADLAAGLGLILPALTRIAPQLTVWAAVGATVLQAFAIVLHASRGELAVLPVNVLLIALQVFVIWGRTKKAPIMPR
ncbi:MAG TPA: DoxX family protein [Ramlibacter sp.]|uniref:DoxX family protein n=1 Tax=Ramlibacter sp. TaxID=1917967 RepID=UPI002D739531|nr:DoxX family protein [Ramlibacter sp.]HZY19192.1 DoxX family protein [Ramlibacter sp.]